MKPFARSAVLLAALSMTGEDIVAAAPDAPHAAELQSSGTFVEIETPMASAQAPGGFLRRPKQTGTSPAVVLLHSCSGHWRHTDEDWGKRISSWDYLTLSVDSFGARGIKRDDLNSADECRNMVAGRDGRGLSREKGQGIPTKLIVYPTPVMRSMRPPPRIRRTCWDTISSSSNR
ncbi:MAG: hypothetical protein DI543_10150 [Bradyrhizobium icense]|jgi:hypothetical protein|nr:MAG: hypothetical protein DI543_10150 [Bradyrhizobium icense]